ncbi:histidine triad nucleotide-binding protein [bacterium]|nr:histidine triad nucleotide-binding protein [bacterium]
MENCLFCKIIKGEIPSNKVYEDEKTYAFYDISPQAPTHILVIPKIHVSSLNELEDVSVMSDIYNAVRNIVQELGIKEYRTVINTGADAGQTVFHIHLHILAGRPLLWPPG